MVGVGKVGRTGEIGRGEQQRTCRVSMACTEEKSQLPITLIVIFSTPIYSSSTPRD